MAHGLNPGRVNQLYVGLVDLPRENDRSLRCSRPPIYPCPPLFSRYLIRSDPQYRAKKHYLVTCNKVSATVIRSVNLSGCKLLIIVVTMIKILFALAAAAMLDTHVVLVIVVLWGFVWVNLKLNCSLYPFVCFFLSIRAWVI